MFLPKKCALSNNKEEIGDFVTDHMDTIKVGNIKIDTSAFGSLTNLNIPLVSILTLVLQKKKVSFKSGEKEVFFK